MAKLLDILASFSMPVVVNGKPVFRSDGKRAYVAVRSIEEIDAAIAQGVGTCFLRAGVQQSDAKQVAENMKKATGFGWAFSPETPATGTTKATSARIGIAVDLTGLGGGKY